MFRISQRTEYALRAMIELSLRRGQGLTPAREIAAAHNIPLRFLEQQLGALHKAGLVESFRGAGGGCRLSRDPADVRVSEIVDAIEGPTFTMFCLEPEDHSCFADARCGLQTLWGDVQQAVRAVLERTTVKQLAERHRRLTPEQPVFAPDELVLRPRA